jgi:phospholipase C
VKWSYYWGEGHGKSARENSQVLSSIPALLRATGLPFGGPDYFQPHHQPFNYFAAFAPGTNARTEHLKDFEPGQRVFERDARNPTEAEAVIGAGAAEHPVFLPREVCVGPRER